MPFRFERHQLAQRFHAALRSSVDAMIAHARWIVLAAFAITIPAAYLTARLYLHLRSDMDALLPPKAPSVVAIDELRARTSGQSYLGIVVDAGAPENAAAARRLVDDLAAKIEAYPPDLRVASVATGVRRERAFLERHAGLYVDEADLARLRDEVRARRDWEVSNALGVAVDEEPPPIHLDDVRRRYEAKLGPSAAYPNDRFESPDGRTSVLLVELEGLESGSALASAVLGRVRADVRALGGPDAYAPGIRIGYAGDVAARAEELEALVVDLRAASLLVFAAVGAVILLYYRWWKALLVLVAPLVTGTTVAFALCSLPPLSLTALNSNTAFLGAIIIGNGVNTGIILLARYEEERRSGVAVRPALVTAVETTGRATLTAALAAALAYGSLVFTGFRGFSQFGWIGAVGMTACWISTLVLVPSLLALVDHRKTVAAKGTAAIPGTGRFLTHIVAIVRRAPALVLAGAAIATMLSIGVLSRLDRSWLELDFGKLRRADTWTRGEGYWGSRMNDVLGRYLTPSIALTDSAAETLRFAHEVRTEAAHELSDVIASVVTFEDVLPRNQEAKIAILRDIRTLVTPRMQASLAPNDRERLDTMLSEDALRPLTGADLPSSLVDGMRDGSGRIDRTVLVYPTNAFRAWEADELSRFVRRLRGAADRARVDGERAPRIAGTVFVSYDVLETLERDGPLVTALSFAFVVALVVLAYRANRASALVIASITAAVLWLVGLLRLFSINLTFANLVAFPITFGIGADYAVNVIGRFRVDRGRDVLGAIRHTGGAVLLASATTVIGYASLLMAKNRALFQFGVLAVLGEIASVTASIFVLPSALQLLAARREHRRARSEAHPTRP